PTKGVLKKVGNTYYWDFAVARTVAKRRTRAASYKPQVVASAKSRRAPRTRTISSSAPITQASITGRGRRVYRGRPIDLDFKDADIHNLLRLLADVGGVNIVIPDEIKASVTVRLRRVPWDQAMEVILASKGLWYRREGDLIRIAPRKLLDAEDKAEAERRKAMAASEAPEPEIFTLNYANGAQIRAQLAPLLSPKGRIEVDQRTNSLIINDIRAHRRRVIDMVRRLDTQTPQIQIEARIVEARTTFVRQFGIQWGGGGTASTATGNATGLVFPSTVAVRGAADDPAASVNGLNAVPTDFAVNMPAAIGAGSGGGLGFSFGSLGGNFNLSLRLSALEDIGTARIVSAPKITTINNVAATISSGVSIPISVVSANGAQTQFVPADLSLQVTPTVSQRDCSISMAVNVSKNEPDFANTGSRGDPSIIRREAQTTIIVADGETSVIGGIYTRNTGRSYSKVPYLAEIPILGLLFKSRRDTDERSEVLVFITPKITNRAFLTCE
ncbi:MAG: type IV pilus secretin PilQ, partial [Deltaproteobacteria bacterium]|nr:type IV pilus secretin PilQ [Deltaproteobacteria bacterium]